jgi:hypothetical protein
MKLSIILGIFASCVVLAAAAAKTQNFLRLLSADAPAVENKEKLMLFGQFVGSWEFDGVGYSADGTRTTDKGEIHFSWVLQGRAVQDLWIERESTDPRPKIYGSTIRFYDPKTDTWSSTWIEPNYGIVSQFTGRKIGDEIVLEGKDKQGVQIHWVFSQIKQDSFHWRGERLTEGKWRVYEELDARRML